MIWNLSIHSPFQDFYASQNLSKTLLTQYILIKPSVIFFQDFTVLRLASVGDTTSSGPPFTFKVLRIRRIKKSIYLLVVHSGNYQRTYFPPLPAKGQLLSNLVSMTLEFAFEQSPFATYNTWNQNQVK